MSVDRGFTWMDDETVALIEIWGKDDVQIELNGSKRNFSVFERIASELADVGFSRTAYQCREKIKRLRKEYQIAKYCVQNNICQKKPMKHYELVDQVLNREAIFKNANYGPINSDQEDELHFSFNPEHESDASNSGPSSDLPLQTMLLPVNSLCDSNEPKTGGRIKSNVNSPNGQNDSNDTIVNADNDINENEHDSILDDSESPWVPNVVLVEKDQDDSIMLGETSAENGMHSANDNERSSNLKHPDSPITGDEEPPQKRRKQEKRCSWFRNMMEKVTDRFVKYQEEADKHFLERLTNLERTRIKRDEEMQKLWMEFEEHRRKEEQQHELKMINIFGQFVNKILDNENASLK